MPRRRVLVLSLHPAAPGGAASTHAGAIASGLAELGWEVDLHHPPPSAEPSLADRIRGWLTALIGAARVLRHADVVYVRSHPAALPLVLCARALRVPTVQEVNGPHEDYIVAWPAFRRIPWVLAAPVDLQLRLAAEVVAVTHGLSRWVEERTGKPATVVIPNGVDVEQFLPSAQPPPGLPPRYIAFVGALAPWQGITELLAATRHPEWPRGVRLVIAGDGSERARVTQATAEAPDRVIWLGAVPHQQVPGLLAGAVAAAVTSTDRRGTGVAPLKLYEAMAAGAPIIAGPVDGLEQTVRQERCGIVVPNAEAAELARAAAGLATDEDTRRAFGERGREAAVARHSWSRRAEETADLLGAVLESTVSRSR